MEFTSYGMQFRNVYLKSAVKKLISNNNMHICLGAKIINRMNPAIRFRKPIFAGLPVWIFKKVKTLS